MALLDMQTRLKAVLEEMAGIDAKPTRTADEDTKYNGLITEGYALKAQIEASVRAGDLTSWANKSAGMLHLTGGQNGGATVTGMRAAGAATLENRTDSILVNSEGEGILDDAHMRLLRDPDYTRAWKSYIRRGGLDRMRDSDGLKVLQEGADTAGGFLVPEEVLNRIIAKQPTPTRVASRVQRMTTSRDQLVVPKVNYSTDNTYTTGMRVTWTGEIPSSATTHRVTEPVWGQLRVPVYTAMMSIPLTRDMVEDSAVDIVGWTTGKFSETNDLLRDNMALNGTGVLQPHGILVNPNATNNPATVVSGAATALTWGGLQDLTWAVPEQYDERCAFVFNKTSTGLAIAKLVDGDGRPLWTQGVQDSGLVGSPLLRRLLGYEVLYSAFMPDVGAGTYPIIFGDLQGYVLVDRVGFSIEVLRELYAETNQLLLLGRVRFGGLVAEDWRLKIQTVSA